MKALTSRPVNEAELVWQGTKSARMAVSVNGQEQGVDAGSDKVTLRAEATGRTANTVVVNVDAKEFTFGGAMLTAVLDGTR